ncbi:unnamed protein product [Lota lota]
MYRWRQRKHNLTPLPTMPSLPQNVLSLRIRTICCHFTVTHFPRLSGPSRYVMMRTGDGEEVRPVAAQGSVYASELSGPSDEARWSCRDLR